MTFKSKAQFFTNGLYSFFRIQTSKIMGAEHGLKEGQGLHREEEDHMGFDYGH